MKSLWKKVGLTFTPSRAYTNVTYYCTKTFKIHDVTHVTPTTLKRPHKLAQTFAAYKIHDISIVLNEAIEVSLVRAFDIRIDFPYADETSQRHNMNMMSTAVFEVVMRP
jgi:hypothetical protein